MSRRAKIGVAALCALAAWSAGAAWAQPMSPLDPTHKDCGELGKQFTAMEQSLTEQIRDCMKGEPVMGVGEVGCNGTRVYTAWIQCRFLEERRCQVTEARRREMDTCNQRAQARAERERRKAEADSKTKQRLADWSSRARKAREIVSLVKDPNKYLKNYLTTRLADHTHVQRLIFRPDGSLDTGRAQQLYLGLHDFARTGRVTANPLIGQIQREAFRDIGIAHADTMRSLDKLIADMRSINADLQGTPLRPPAPPPAPKPPPVAQIPPGWQACSCPNAHAHAGRYVLGILYHPPGMSCPQ
jgi:hypothetical protein